MYRLCLLACLLTSGTIAITIEESKKGAIQDKASGAHTGRQTPEDLGFSGDGDSADDGEEFRSQFGADACLDLGAQGFPLQTFDMLQEVNWDANSYFAMLQGRGFADDALQMTGPQDAILHTDCMKENFRGKTKHIFVGDSQIMALRNALHRRNKCPEIWYVNTSKEQALRVSEKSGFKLTGRLHSSTAQTPQEMLPRGCSEEGIASYIYWDAWAHPSIPVEEIKREMEMNSVDPKQGDNVVVWVGSNFLHAKKRTSVLLDTIDRLRALGVKMVWDSPTFQDVALMAATSQHDAGRDSFSEIPVTFTAIGQRKASGELGSDEFRTEKALLASGVEIPMTKRWQLTNRYRGLQCDGTHTDMRARDPLFYQAECPAGKQQYGASVYCSWVEPLQTPAQCPAATGLDDLVLQSGLYSICAGHERPFCYQHTTKIR